MTMNANDTTRTLTDAYKALDAILDDWAHREGAERTGASNDEYHGFFLPTEALDIALTGEHGIITRVDWQITSTDPDEHIVDGRWTIADGVIVSGVLDEDGFGTGLRRLIDECIEPDWNEAARIIDRNQRERETVEHGDDADE